MIKRIVVTGLKARGYVDGRYVGEEKKEAGAGRDDDRGRGKRRGKAGVGFGAGAGAPKGRGKKRGAVQAGQGGQFADNLGNTTGAKRGRRGKPQGRGAAGPVVAGVPGIIPPPQGGRGRGQGQPRNQPRKNRTGKKTPFRQAPVNLQSVPSPSEAADMRRLGDGVKSGQFAEALAAQANVKRERLHKVLAHSGHGSRRDMEIMISSGRVMVNGIVATTGTQVSPGDNVMVDHRPVKIKFSEELPRILLYHKPEGEIVTTSDPGNRITVFDNLPRVENGKWVAIGRLDINTSGLLIFTTSGELANRFMHPRYEVEREYAVRILGELTEEQTQALLTGVNIDFDQEDDELDAEPAAPARFDTIEKREGEGGGGANQWYHVTIKEGRNREVRKMFESQGLTVSRLIRTRFGKIELPPRLGRGKMMELSPDQVRNIMIANGMGDELPIDIGGGPAKRPRGRERVPGQVRQQPARTTLRGPPGLPSGLPLDDLEETSPGNVLESTGEPAERSKDGSRKPRSRRGGRNSRRGAPGGATNQPPSQPASGIDGADFVADATDGSAAPHRADRADVPGDAVTDTAAKGPRPAGTGRNPRNRSRRNFRGRNGRRGKGAAGEGNAEPGNSGNGSNAGAAGNGETSENRGNSESRGNKENRGDSENRGNADNAGNTRERGNSNSGGVALLTSSMMT
jgi:23S rRNA pseudouridine2605 synthase